MTIEIGSRALTMAAVLSVAHKKTQVRLSTKAKKNVSAIRAKLNYMLADTKPYYGINTGFGALAETKIPADKLEKLQKNLILSHAVGVFEPLDIPTARALMLLRANTLSGGYSGCTPQLIETILTLLNADVTPFVPKKGSVGASGDLAPLAHLALLLLGIGPGFIGQQKTTAKRALAHAGLKPIVLKAKEGLALINGTQAMLAHGIISLGVAGELCTLANMIGAMSLEALMGSHRPFDARIHRLRPHPGQLEAAKEIRQMLVGSEIKKAHNGCNRVQDPYSFRCMPQVHGASLGVLWHVQGLLECEIGSITDNPLLFEAKSPNGLDILSGGNFHGQPLALGFDYLGMAMAELAAISERRMDHLLNPMLSNGLPAFLTPDAGLNSGFMIWQVTATSLINENRVLCHPASTDSIPTSAGREDHVSMGMTSALKLSKIIENVKHVLAIELIMACQALDMRLPLKPAKKVQILLREVRKQVPFYKNDQYMQKDFQAILNLMNEGLSGAINNPALG